MPATATRIGFVTQATRNVVASDSAVTTKYGALARDTRDEPIESFFDDTADAQAMLDERFALLKADRRRFQVALSGVETGLALDYSQAAPAATLIDAERAMNGACAIVEIGVDFGANKSILTVWG
jgi:hypothetical protein